MPTPSHTRGARPARLLAAATTASALLLAGCAANELSTGQPTTAAPVEFGNATPAPSPQAASTVTTEAIDQQVLAAIGGSATDLVGAGDTLLLRGTTGIAVGNAEDLLTGKATTLQLADTCGPVAATILDDAATQFAVACPQGANGSAEAVAYVIDGTNPNLDTQVALPDASFDHAVITSDNYLVAASSTGTNVVAINRNDNSEKTIKLDQTTDQLLAVGDTAEIDGVASANSELTKLGGVSIKEYDAAYLRGGRALARMTPGPNNTFFISDQRANQVMVYTMNPIVMLHQTRSTGESPWALAWDKNNETIWVSTTADNKLSAFHIADGVPTPHGQVDTPANVRAVVIAGDGSAYTLSENATELGVIKASDLKAAADAAAAS